MTTWMRLEGIMLRETKQRKMNTAWYHSYVDLKKGYLFIWLHQILVVEREFSVGAFGT